MQHGLYQFFMMAIWRVQSFSPSKTLIHSSSKLWSTPQPPAVSLENLSCSHNGGETWQLKDASYVLARGSKVALVGRNGAGKSTMLRIIAENACLDTNNFDKKDIRYTGQVVTPRDVRVAYVEQEPHVDAGLSVADALLGMRGENENDIDNNSVYATVRQYTKAVDQAESDPDAFAKASADMEAKDGWGVLTKAEEVATKLRVRHLYDQQLDKLSGGERKRVALAAALVQEPDVLLLDEPTNFLSLAGVQWLVDILKDKKLTILMVTHDRAFLGDVCDTILELDRGSVYEYPGSYAHYLQAKEERLAAEDAAIRAAKAKYRVELDWMRRQPQARESKSKARIDAFYKLEKATKPRPRESQLNIESDAGSRRIGGKIISMRGVSLKFGERVMLDDFSYDFCKGDRICFSGANGVGKTTLVNVITGQHPPDTGDIIVGDTIALGIYDQKGIDIDDPSQTVLSFVLEKVNSRDGNAMSEGPDEARQLLRQFEFPRERWNERISMLSGGEKRRLQMLSVFSERPNVLILDEPSVDCDLDTLNALESYLCEFQGVLIVVSHDRLFADTVTDHLFVFEGDGVIKDFPGTLSEYASTLVELENESIARKSTVSNVEKSEKKVSKEKRVEQQNKVRQAKKDMLNIDRALEKLRDKANKLQKEMDSSADEGWTVLAGLTDSLNEVNDEIEEKELLWIESATILEEAEMVS